MDFDKILNYYIENNTLTDEMLIQLFLIYDETFNDGTLTPQEVLLFLDHPVVQTVLFPLVKYAIKLISIKKGIVWTIVYDENFQILAQFRND